MFLIKLKSNNRYLTAVRECRSVASSMTEEYEHIPQEEKDKVIAACDEAKSA